MNTLTFQLRDKDTAHVLFQGKSLLACLVFWFVGFLLVVFGFLFFFFWLLLFLDNLHIFSLATLSTGEYTGKLRICFVFPLTFQQPNWMPALSWLQKLPVSRSLAPANSAGGGTSRKTPSCKPHTHTAQLPFSWNRWLARGGGSK